MCLSVYEQHVLESENKEKARESRRECDEEMEKYEGKRGESSAKTGWMDRGRVAMPQTEKEKGKARMPSKQWQWEEREEEVWDLETRKGRGTAAPDTRFFGAL